MSTEGLRKPYPKNHEKIENNKFSTIPRFYYMDNDCNVQYM
jgi:hypothetical protein